MTLPRKIPGARGRRPAVLASIAAALAVVAAESAPALAATYTAHDGQSLLVALQSANSHPGPSTINLGAGIYAPDATLTVDGDVTIAGPSGPGLRIVGAAVAPVGASVLVVSPGAHATLLNVTVMTAGTIGGAAAVDVSGSLDVESSSLEGNDGPNLTVESGGSATVRNSTISDGLGAGLVDAGSAKLINSTVAANASEGIDNSSGTLSLVNTIVAGNGSPDCATRAASTDHSLDGDGTCGVLGALSHVNPLLGRLAANGGPTSTRALLPGSPAIGAGDASACPAEDQRHYARPRGRCDLGAYQSGAQPAGSAPPGATATPGSTGSGTGSRRGGLTGVSGHGSLHGPARAQIKFSVHARVAQPHGNLIYHDVRRRVWLRGLNLASVRIDATRGTATIRGTGMELVRRRRVSFTATITDHAGVRSVRLRLSSGYAGGGTLASGTIAFTGAGVRDLARALPRSNGGN